ncbi:putative multiple sugar transport system ATP-binding protein [Hydrogenispora ethanolica]|jgi:putative multiple sugar transport system ATP-binding protein|uniref:Putative multiple sugar transport system ATP-binding protein n=1 Tax=Hydrogenispora ethanolica TaxID=1082276 RepID=A0A4R1QPS8_HYDET|nr:multiple monosaccharide ABC transporter ATP-binding protein [Hydrogenispora ethanolica]TCL55367.1 putative multiple sugar transport system ATP-binding protein [Hydrogenispora ethanolica]
MESYILEMKNITKLFPGVKALDNVNLKIRPNQIHALVGENGAGKSTLMNILSGVYPYGTYSGDIIVNGEICKFRDIRESEAKGIAIIHQELALIPSLSIAENVFIGNEQTNNGFTVNWNKTRLKTLEIFKKVGLHENIDTRVMDIGMGKQQLVEISKALSKDVKILILDEPTAALNDEDSNHLLNLILDLKEHGITSIIISHKLQEVIKVADEITVIRDGATIETLVKGEDSITEDRIIKGMVGREIKDRFPKRHHQIGEIRFEVQNWSVHDPIQESRKVIKDVNLHVRKGEVVGIAGLMGAGRTELAMSIFGKAYGRKITGTIRKDGQTLNLHSVSDAIQNRITYSTEDRKTAGLILSSDIKKNITLAALPKISKCNVVDENQEIQVGEEYRGKLRIKSASVFQNAGNLSGGNQQKVVFSKCIFADPDILFLDEPTRGIDVGAKYEIYSIINELAEEGKSIIMISSELPEVLGMCDRIYVMNEGRIVGEFLSEEASQEKIMQCIMQSNKEVVM